MARNDFSINDAPTMRPVSATGGNRRLAAGDVILGRYTVVRELGEGGMGVVYQCLDTVGGVEVAVKGLPPEVSRNEDEMDDIRANYQIVRKLRHPNIAGVATLERDAAAGDYYLVMDLAAGVTLKRWVRRHPDAGLDAKFAILRQVAAALDYAHAEKVIHRDVKPENVMVDDGGRVKVLDFGLAAQIRSSQSRTSNTVTSKGGTPGYKSPEQWRGKPQREPADVYSFGVMAYWLFSGHLPFDGDDPVVLGHAVLSAPVEPIPDLPAHMNAALVKALAKQPEERFASCGAVVDALEGKIDISRVEHVERVDGVGGARRPAEPVGSRVPRDRVDAPQPGGPRSVAAVKGILAAVALALAVVGGWWLANGRNETTGTNGTTETNVVQVPSVPTTPSAPSTTPAQPVPAPAPHTIEPLTKTFTLPDGERMEMIYVPPGSFTMGSPESEEGRDDTETQHRVTLTKGYWLGKYEVTQRQWESVMGANPSSFKGRDRPVDQVSWNDCQRFIAKVDAEARRQFGGGARLPTEAEWEYACRAGTTGPYGGNGNLDDMGWYGGNSGDTTHPVGQKLANAWGFHDMHGNVWEWCQDWYGAYQGNENDPRGSASGVLRVLRGGCWPDVARGCRSASRDGFDPALRNMFSGIGGFRLCCSAGPRE